MKVNKDPLVSKVVMVIFLHSLGMPQKIKVLRLFG